MSIPGVTRQESDTRREKGRRFAMKERPHGKRANRSRHVSKKQEQAMQQYYLQYLKKHRDLERAQQETEHVRVGQEQG